MSTWQTYGEASTVNEIIVPGLYLLAGICAYATVHHLASAINPPRERMQLVFAGMCLLMVPFALSHALTLHAANISEFAESLKWNLSAILLFFLLLPWFIALYAGKHMRPLIVGLSVWFAVMFVVNLTQPYSLQYDHIDGLRRLQLPWGEVVTHGIGRNGAWAYIAIGSVLVAFGYALYALGGLYRRDRRGADLAMLLAIGFFMISGIEGILVRLSILNFFEFGPFGFLTVVIVMSAALTHETQQRLRISERRFRSLVEQSPFSIQMLAPDGATRQVNPAWEKLWGVKAEQVADYDILRDPQLIEKGAMPYLERGFAGKATEIPPIIYDSSRSTAIQGPASNRWVRAFIYPIKDEKDSVSEVVLMHEDVTDKKRVEDAIRLIAAGVSSATGERFFRQLVQSLGKLFNADYVFIGVLDEHDAQRVNTLAVSAHGEIAPDLSYTLAGTPCANVMVHSTCAYPRDVQRLFPEDRLLAEMGVEGYIGTPLFDVQGKPLGLIVVLYSNPIEHIEQVKEILEIFAARASAELQRLQAETRIRRMAYEDYLTGLASRAYLHERLSEILDRARRSNECGALLLIDLDHFKTINDALSHNVGDEVLRAVGRRLSEVAGERALIARLGGDEFVALVNTETAKRSEAESAARDLAQQIMDKLQIPIQVGERAFSIGASIGAVIFPENSETELDILRHADMALYRAKNQGRGNTQFYLPALEAAAANRLQLEEGLRRVIANNELTLHFQPQIDAAGQFVGAEALLRWHHPEMGNIPPATFIPVAEETGLIHPIGQWVFDQACRHLKSWLQSGVPFSGHLSINVCPWQFIRPDFVSQVRESIRLHQVDPRHLMVELTETALLYDVAETIDKLKMLRALGLRISLDDFGTGYSSLAYLKDLPLDQLKIDKAFVSELDHTEEHPLVESMLAIGRHMRLAVVAEGVETEMQRDILVQLGCVNFQGYLFSRPLPEKEFMQWLSEKRFVHHGGNPRHNTVSN
jgi:diguanylate cyclase (GGDEF)-like protein/PAS domain S-box-containing protein